MGDRIPHGIVRKPPKYVVLAGNIQEFFSWTTNRQIPDGEAFYVSSSYVLQGRKWPSDATFHVIGSFHDRSDALEVLEVIYAQLPKAILFTDLPFLAGEVTHN